MKPIAVDPLHQKGKLGHGGCKTLILSCAIFMRYYVTNLIDLNTCVEGSMQAVIPDFSSQDANSKNVSFGLLDVFYFLLMF